MSLSPEQLAQRKTGITATDAAAILGLHPYRAPIDVFLDKTDRATPFVGNERTKWGHILEAPIREDYAERQGVRVEVPGTLEHPTVTWAKATPDGICYVPRRSHPRNGLEIKTHSFRAADQYGDPGTDEVPQHELVQCMWNMFVSGLDDWDLVAFVDGQPADYRIRRDDELIGLMREECEKFLVDNIRADVPPDPDGSKSYGSYLSTAYPQRRHSATCASRKPKPKPCDCVAGALLSIDDKPGALAQVGQLRVALDQLAHTKTEVEILKQNLKAVCGEHAGLEWSEPTRKGGRDHIYYRLAKDSTEVDWQAAWRFLVTEAQLVCSVKLDTVEVEDEAIQQVIAALDNIADEKRSMTLHTHTVTGTRRFNVPRHWSKNPSTEE